MRRMQRPCSKPGCPNLTASGAYCDEHRGERGKEYDQRRGSAWSRGYDGRWRKLRLTVLREEPLCRVCMAQGRVTPAQHVDHIDGNVRNMSRSNLQPLCASCHSKKTVREDGGFSGSEALKSR